MTKNHMHSNRLNTPESLLHAHFTGAERSYTALLIKGTKETPPLLSCQRPDISSDIFHQNLEEIGESLRVIEDTQTGKTFEIAEANTAEDPETADAEFATYNSAISSNAGNAVEFAENAALHPSARRVYIATPGNGFSSPYDSDEIKHLKKHGTFVHNGQPLPTIQALGRALTNEGIGLRRLSANSGGGNTATALMAHLPEGSISHVYLKGRTGLVRHHPLGLMVRMAILENFRSSKDNREHSVDPWKLDDRLWTLGERATQDKITELEKKYQRLGRVTILSKLISDGVVLAKGTGKHSQSPAIADTSHALHTQPDAQLTYHFSVKDRQYRQKFDMLTNFIKILNQNGKVQGLFVPGTHADHTFTPSVRWAFETYAFNR
jgi:hypothetical protein